MEYIANLFMKSSSQLLPRLLTIFLSIIIFFLFFLLRKPLVRILSKGLCKLLKRLPTASEIVKGFEKPAAALLVVAGAYGAAFLLAQGFGVLSYCHGLINAAIRISVIIAITWGMMNAAAPIVSAIQGSRTDLDRTLVAFFSKIVQVLFLIIAGVIIIGETGYDITGMITGLGLTGLTFSLAAKDSASNLFGGLVIISDKPFGVGDWIQTPEMEGIVTDITLRSTRIRTFKDAEVIIPNSTLANTSIINWSRMSKRRVHFTLTLSYQNSQEALRHGVEAIETVLRGYPEEIEQDSILVTFDAFGPYSLNLEIYYYAVRTTWVDYMRLKESVNFDIRAALEALKVEIAYPTQVLLNTGAPDGEALPPQN